MQENDHILDEENVSTTIEQNKDYEIIILISSNTHKKCLDKLEACLL